MVREFWSNLRRLPAERIVLQDDSRALTRAQLEQQVSQVADALIASGVRRLGLHADNSASWVVLDLASQQAGVVCVPLPLFFSGSQLTHVLASCGIDSVATVAPASFDSLPAESGDGLAGLTLLRNRHASAVPLPEGTGKVTFTSGSTGTPKGVCLSWAQQFRQARVLAETVDLPGPRHLCVLPLPTLLENIAGVYAPLMAGGEVVVSSLSTLGFEGSRLVSLERFLAAITQTRPQTLVLIPQLLHALVQSAKRGWKPPPMDFIAVGGSRVSPALIDEARALGLPVYEGYGLSECASVVSLNTPRHDALGTAGRILSSIQVVLEDGEIVIEGNAMLGYVGDPSSWHKHAFASGDTGYLDGAGFLHINGRRKNLLISSYGRNIAPEWVESEMLATPVLADAVVFGDAQAYCVALVSTRDPNLSDEEVQTAIDAANARLPDYAQVLRWHRLPAALSAAHPELLTANGRPRRAEIAQAFASQLGALYSTPRAVPSH